jgi:hypothetical protein
MAEMTNAKAAVFNLFNIGSALFNARLRTISNKLIRELQRKLPTHSLFETYQKDFLFYVETIETLLPYSYCLWSLPLAMT